jgi:hypothetical protein
MEEGRLENESATLKKASTYITGDMEAPQTVSEAEGAPAGSLADPGPDLDERIVGAFADAARAADVSRLLPEIEAAATAADVAAAEARSKALDPMLPRAEVVAVRRQSDDAGFERDRLTEAAKKLATRLVELKAAEDSAALRAEHEALSSERDRLVGELVGMTDTLVRIGKLAMQIDACDREVRRWNPLGGRTHGYIRPVLGKDLPPALAGLFADARVMDSFIGMAMSPPLPSSPSAKLRAV